MAKANDEAEASPFKLAPLPGSTAQETGNAPLLPRFTFASQSSLKAIGIETATASVRALDEYIEANGVVGYNENRYAQLSLRIPGIVYDVEKKLGQSVKAGDILSLLDSVEVGRAKATFLQEVVDAELKAKNLERLMSVSGVIAERQLREAEAALREARISRFNAQQTLNNLGLPVQYDEDDPLSDDELSSWIHFVGLPPEIREKLDPKTTTANLVPLRSPFDGVVVGREVVVGEVLEHSQVQFVIADVRTMWIHLSVGRDDAKWLDLGQEVVFQSDSCPREIRCKLTWISTEVGARTRTVQARADAENPLLESAGADASEGQRVLRANIFGTAKIHVRHQPEAIVVPEAAVQWLHRDPIVFVVDAQSAAVEPRRVELGDYRREVIEIRGGLRPGETVVTNGSRMLKSQLLRNSDDTQVSMAE